MTNSIINLSIEELKEIINEATKAGALEVLEHWHKQEQDKDLILKTEGVARLFNVTVGTVMAWRRDGLIPVYNIGNTVYYKKNEVIEALMTKNNKTEATRKEEKSLKEIAESLTDSEGQTRQVITLRYCELYKKTTKQGTKMFETLIKEKAIVKHASKHMRYVLPTEPKE